MDRKLSIKRYCNKYKNYTVKDCCDMCGEKKPYKLLIHHKDFSRKLGEKNMNNDPNNLMTLCYTCHMVIHGRYKYKKFKEDEQGRLVIYYQYKNEK